MTRAVIEWFLYMTCGAVLLRSVLRFRQEKLDCRVAIGGAPSTVVARPAAFSKKNGPTMPEIPTEQRPLDIPNTILSIDPSRRKWTSSDDFVRKILVTFKILLNASYTALFLT